jgi:hypothetical protein
VVVSETLHTESKVMHQYTLPHFWRTVHRLCGLTFVSDIGCLLIKCLSVSCGTVLPEECQPGTLCSITFAYLTDSPSINWIWNNNWSLTASYAILPFVHLLSLFQMRVQELIFQVIPCIDCNSTLKSDWLFFAFNYNSPGVMTVICGNHSDDLLSLHFVTQRGPECCAVIVPFFWFSVSLFWFSFSVLTQSQLCMVFSVLARQDEL